MRGIARDGLRARALGASPAPASMYDAIEVVVQPQPAVEGGPLGRFVSEDTSNTAWSCSNHSKTVDHQVRLVHPAPDVVYYNDYLERNSRTVQVAATGQTLVVSLFQPCLPVAIKAWLSRSMACGKKEIDRVAAVPSGRVAEFGYSTPARVRRWSCWQVGVSRRI